MTDYLCSFRPYRLPLRPSLRTAHGWWNEREGILLRLEDGQGRVGFGEIAPIPWFGTETLAEAAAVCAQFGDAVSAATLDAVPARFGCVRFAVALARNPPAAATPSRRLPIAALLPAGRDALRALPAKLEGGYLTFKWKVGVGAVDDELGLLDDLLAALPGHARLRLDANGAWTTRQAARWLDRCAGRPIEFVEQPVAPAETDSLLGLAGDFPVRLALDESVVRLDEARRWQALGWPGVFVVKPALAGPLPELVNWVLETRADVVFSSAIETTVASSAILHTVLAADLTRRALGFGAGGLFGDRRWDGPVLGPVADAAGLDRNPGEAAWNALN